MFFFIEFLILIKNIIVFIGWIGNFFSFNCLGEVIRRVKLVVIIFIIFVIKLRFNWRVEWGWGGRLRG